MAKTTTKKPRQISTLLDASLTPVQAEYVHLRAKGVSSAAASKELGFTKQTGHELETKANVQQAMAVAYKAYESAAGVEKQDVVDGILEAIEMARLLSDPQGMIAGWRELAKLCGHYAPEVKKVELSVTAARAKSKYEMLPDDQLFQIAMGTIIDGTAVEVHDGAA